tara:strand:+ start:2191 stop:3450 length:1260 start_codon:yes stop_codon:yes gene_type:complete
MTDSKPFDLNLHVARLLREEPFFAALSRRIDKVPNTSVPTAGVRVTPEGKLEMAYNPEFFAKLPDVQRLGVLKHEFYHLVFEHVTGRMPDKKMTKIWNIATDLSINTHLRGELPDGCCMPGEGPFEAMPHGKSAEWYLKALKNQQEQPEGEGEGEDSQEGDGEGQGEGQGGDPSKGEGQGQGQGQGGEPQFDDHEGWGEASDEAKQIAKERIKEYIKDAAEEASSSRGWGTVSGSVRKQILDSITPKVDWKKVLRYFIKTSQRANKRSTVRRLNKRYPYQHPGTKVLRQANIAISIDQSGSVSDKMLAAFFSELNKLSDIASFTVVPFDTRVDETKVYVWKKGETRKRERVLRGGTCFNAPTKYVNGHSFDGHIVLTDMEAPKPIASKCQRMWMTTEHHAKRPYFKTSERVIGIPVEGY